MHHNSSKKAILISGAAGNLGQELIVQLSNIPDYDIAAFDVNKDVLESRFSEFPGIALFDSGDWENRRLPLETTDIVIHCAFNRSPSGKALAESLLFTRDFLSEAVRNGCSVINISSRSVYGQNPVIPWLETTAPEPDSLYAVSKFSTELILEEIAKNNQNIGVTSVRLAGLIGKGMDERIVTKLAKNAIRDRFLKITGENQQFSFLDIRDAASAILSLLAAPSSHWSPAYNIGPNKVYTILELAELIRTVAEKITHKPVSIQFEKKDVSLIDSMNSDLFYETMNWKPQYSMKKSIEDIVLDKLKHSERENE